MWSPDRISLRTDNFAAFSCPRFGPSRAPTRLSAVFQNQEKSMLWTIVAVVLVLWLLGFSLSIGGSLIHLLLVVALAVVVINLLSGRRGAA